MYNIVFVILNYNIYEETIQCVLSIREKIDTDSYHIVIVDNHSQNDALMQLEKEYRNDNDVTIIPLKENTGFAKGNNIGIEKARLLGAQFVCCINDDAALVTEGFYHTLEEKAKIGNIGAIGPAILQKDGRIGSFNHTFQSLEWHRSYLDKLEHECFHYSLVGSVRNYIVNRPKLVAVFYRIANLFRNTKGTVDKDELDVVLQGSCIVFTPLFFKYLSGFNPATFLYGEEEFLMADLLMNNLRSLYVPEIVVYHKGGVSTKKITGAEAKKKWEFRHYHALESYKKFVDYIELNQHRIYHD